MCCEGYSAGERKEVAYADGVEDVGGGGTGRRGEQEEAGEGEESAEGGGPAGGGGAGWAKSWNYGEHWHKYDHQAGDEAGLGGGCSGQARGLKLVSSGQEDTYKGPR